MEDKASLYKKMMGGTSGNLVRLASTNQFWSVAVQDEIKAPRQSEPYEPFLINEFKDQVVEAMTSPNAVFVVSQALETACSRSPGSLKIWGLWLKQSRL